MGLPQILTSLRQRLGAQELRRRDLLADADYVNGSNYAFGSPGLDGLGSGLWSLVYASPKLRTSSTFGPLTTLRN